MKGVQVVTAFCLVLSSVGCLPPGQRLLNMEVTHNDQLILRTKFDAPDSHGPLELWSHAGSEPFAADVLIPLTPEHDNPLIANLHGRVEIKIFHVERLMTSATLDGLQLVRRSADKPRWFLRRADARRARDAATD